MFGQKYDSNNRKFCLHITIKCAKEKKFRICSLVCPNTHNEKSLSGTDILQAPVWKEKKKARKKKKKKFLL
jgi:hypothetical protein